ncbi:restriction endonuclease [Micromonospora echinofusca]
MPVTGVPNGQQRQIGAPIVTQLHGVMTTHGAEQGLLVAWGGLKKPA